LFLEINRLGLDDTWGISNPLTLQSTFIDLKEGKVPQEYSLALEELMSSIKSKLGVKPRIDVNCNPIAHKSFFSDVLDTATFRILLDKKQTVRKFEDNRVLNHTIENLIASQTKVFLLAIPQAKGYTDTYLTKVQKIEWENLLQAYNRTYGIPCFSCSHIMQDSDFFDGGHVNYKGARKYDDWFLTKIDSIL
jgi:hypothetical protein